MMRSPWRRNSAPSSAMAVFSAAASRWTRTVSTSRRMTQSILRLTPAAPMTSSAAAAIRPRYGRRYGKSRPNGARRAMEECAWLGECHSPLGEDNRLDQVLIKADELHWVVGVLDPDVGEIQEHVLLVVEII